MTTPRNQQSCPLNEQAVGWALHALEPDEEMAVILHVPTCPSCQAAARDADAVLSHLGASVEQVEPPRSLRDSLLAAAAETAQQPARPQPAPAPMPASRHRTPEPVLTDRGSSRRSPRSWLTRGRLITASAALVAVIAIGGLAVRTAQLEQQSQTLSAQAQNIADLVGQLDRPDVKHAMLANLSTGATTAAVVVVDGKREVYTVSLPANASNNTYVLWGLRAGAAPAPLGAFDVSSTDTGVRTVGTVGENDRFTDYAISIEPGHTAPASPTTVVAKGQVA
jgi:anti-sigma-K factor RskA